MLLGSSGIKSCMIEHSEPQTWASRGSFIPPFHLACDREFIYFPLFYGFGDEEKSSRS
jgi:hypothetical protein